MNGNRSHGHRSGGRGPRNKGPRGAGGRGGDGRRGGGRGPRGGGGRGGGAGKPIVARRAETPPADLPSTEFEQYDLPKPVLAAIAAAGYEKPTPIQEALIPLGLDEKNVVGRSRTGTGKTCAFITPLISLLDEANDEDFVKSGKAQGPVRILIVVPTRELAMQVAGEAVKLTRFLPVNTACVYGGTNIQRQIEELKVAAVVAGTPGRLLDHIGRGTLDLSGLDAIVLDEVDRMYDLGFRDDVDRILRASSNRSQTLLMSATLNADVERLIAKHLSDHERVLIESKSMTVDEVEQVFYFVDPRKKQELLAELIKTLDPECGIVFVRTRFNVDRLAHSLRKMGYRCHEIHSGLQQRKREAIMQDFRDGKFPLLIATDVASRGLDIEGVTHIFNYDLPEVAEDYVHRVGRTARMGRTGHGISFVTPDDGALLTEIEKLINREIRQEQYPGFEVKPPETKRPEEKPRPASLPRWANVVRRRR